MARQARLPLSWTPPRYGAYSLVADYKVGADVLSSQTIHFGVTPRFAKMPVLEAGPESRRLGRRAAPGLHRPQLDAPASR